MAYPVALVKRAQARRSNVRAVAVDLATGFSAAVVPKEDAQADAICTALASEHCEAHIFDDVQPAELRVLAAAMELVECSAGDVVIELRSECLQSEAVSKTKPGLYP